MINKISIIIPTRNRIDKLKRAVLSVIGQIDSTYDIEILIVDDNDIDCTDDILNLLNDIINFVEIEINVIRNSFNHSAANARNLGVEKSQGNFITFLDDDDVYLPGRLLLMYQLLERHNYDYISTYRLYEKNNSENFIIP
ncbi:glycosyltransferase family 2 protein, partial [Providencia rettgeri]|uniref:glycosyltransferase family 2 protein n=1 Tax=Providencia rettgeri TaxID=587 RepID=UPI001EE6F412